MDAQLEAELQAAREAISAAQTKSEVDRGIAMAIEAFQKYCDGLLELMEEIDPDYIPMEL